MTNIELARIIFSELQGREIDETITADEATINMEDHLNLNIFDDENYIEALTDWLESVANELDERESEAYASDILYPAIDITGGLGQGRVNRRCEKILKAHKLVYNFDETL